jgi:predicted secreted protein
MRLCTLAVGHYPYRQDEDKAMKPGIRQFVPKWSVIPILAFAIILLAALVWAVAFDRNTESTETDAGMTSAHVGEVVTIDLSSSPSTGYKWGLDRLPDGIELVDSTFTPPPPDVLGGSGIQHFDVRADRSGTFALVFTLKRPWEPDAVETNTVDLHVG